MGKADGVTKEYLTELVETYPDKKICEMLQIGKTLLYTIKKRYGVKRSPEQVLKNKKQALMDKYGVTNAILIPGAKEKAKTTVAKNAKENPNYWVERNEKSKQTTLLKTGYEYSAQDPDVKRKIWDTYYKHKEEDPEFVNDILTKRKQTTLERYDVENYATINVEKRTKEILSSYDNFVNYVKTRGLFKICDIIKDLKISRSTYDRTIQRFNITKQDWLKRSSHSVGELMVLNFVRSMGFDAFSTKSVIYPYELDIYIPEVKLAIEYNGMYFHTAERKEIDFHYQKFKKCEYKNIKLIQIYEDEWCDDKTNIKIRELIKYHCGNFCDSFFDINNIEETPFEDGVILSLFDNCGVRICSIIFNKYHNNYYCVLCFAGFNISVKNAFRFLLSYFYINYNFDLLYCSVELDKFNGDELFFLNNNIINTFISEPIGYLIADHKRIKILNHNEVDCFEKSNIIYGCGYRIFKIKKDLKGVIKDMASYTKKDSGTKTVQNTPKKDNSEIETMKAEFAALKAQNELLMKMIMEKGSGVANYQMPKGLLQEVTIVHLVERAPGLNTHIELSNTTIDMSVFGEERLLTLSQAEEISGKYRKFFEKGIIAFGADGEELASRFGLKSLKDYSYIGKDFIKQLGGLSLIELENLWNKLAEGHKKFIIEYFKRKVVEGDPAFKDIHKVELLNRLSGGAMSGTTLDFKREAEEAAKKN